MVLSRSEANELNENNDMERDEHFNRYCYLLLAQYILLLLGHVFVACAKPPEAAPAEKQKLIPEKTKKRSRKGRRRRRRNKKNDVLGGLAGPEDLGDLEGLKELEV